MNPRVFASCSILIYISVLWLLQGLALELSFANVITRLTLIAFPIYQMLVLLIYLSEKYIINRIAIYRVIGFHVLMSITFGLSVSIFIPTYAYNNNIVSKENTSQDIINAYKYADKINQEEEKKAYITYYQNNRSLFNEIDFGHVFVDGVADREEKISTYPDVVPDIVYSSLVTEDSINKLDKTDVLFRIQDFISDKNFLTANDLIEKYKKVFGEDDTITYLSVLLEAEQIKEENFNMLIPENERIYYAQLKYFYNLLNSTDVSVETLIFANSMLKAFIGNSSYKNREEVLWLESPLREKLLQKTFFAYDARIHLFYFKDSKPPNVAFVYPSENEFVIWYASNSEYTPETKTVYFKNLYLIGISRSEKLIKWKLKTPYAKFDNSRLYLHSFEENTPYIRYTPVIEKLDAEYSYPQFFQSNIWEIPDLDVKDVSKLIPSYLFIQNKNIIEIFSFFKLWRKYKLPLNILFEYLYDMILYTACFFFFGLSIYVILFRMSKRQIYFKVGMDSILAIIVSYVPIYFSLKLLGVFIIRKISLIGQIGLLISLILILIFLVISNMKTIKEVVKISNRETTFNQSVKKFIAYFA